MPEYETAAVEPASEEEKVLSWRFSEFRRLGMDRVQARVLSESDADLDLVRRLVGAGCPPGLALRIAL